MAHNIIIRTSPTHRVCGSCEQLVVRYLFPKKEFLKKDSEAVICHACKQKATAERCGQPPPHPIQQGRIADSGLRRKPNNFGYCNYIDHLFSLQCFSDIVALGAFTSAKDVSESMAALQGALRHGNIDKDNASGAHVSCICVGDGSTPRSAVLAAYLQRWTCISVDPALPEKWQGPHATVRGLTGFSGTLEEFMASPMTQDGNRRDAPFRHLILLCVHSHARFVGAAAVPNIIKRYHNIPTTLVSLPCCAKFRHVGDIGRPPNVKYDDDCVFSACRSVEIWNF
jgi:hypothetical protein